MTGRLPSRKKSGRLLEPLKTGDGEGDLGSMPASCGTVDGAGCADGSPRRVSVGPRHQPRSVDLLEGRPQSSRTGREQQARAGTRRVLPARPACSGGLGRQGTQQGRSHSGVAMCRNPTKAQGPSRKLRKKEIPAQSKRRARDMGHRPDVQGLPGHVEEPRGGEKRQIGRAKPVPRSWDRLPLRLEEPERGWSAHRRRLGSVPRGGSMRSRRHRGVT